MFFGNHLIVGASQSLVFVVAMMQTSSADACATEDEDVSHRYGSSSPSRYVVFFVLFYFCFLL